PCCRAATKPTCVPAGCEPGSPFGPGVMALALYLRVIQNISYQRLVRLFRDLFGLVISEGALDALLRRAKPGFDAEVAAILARLRKSRLVYSDETGVRVAGKGWWNWVFGNQDIVLHVIRPSRGKEVVEQVLGGHRPAIWVSDLLGSQQGHAEQWQICLAHQLRDCQYAIDAGDTAFAPPMKRLILRAFAIARRRDKLADATLRAYKGRLERELDAIMKLRVEHKDGRRLRKRYAQHRGDAASPNDRTRNAGIDWPGSAIRRRLAACPCRAPESAHPRFASALSANARRRAGSRVPDSACAEPSSGGRDRDCRTALGCRTPPPSLGPNNGVW